MERHPHSEQKLGLLAKRVHSRGRRGIDTRHRRSDRVFACSSLGRLLLLEKSALGRGAAFVSITPIHAIAPFLLGPAFARVAAPRQLYAPLTLV